MLPCVLLCGGTCFLLSLVCWLHTGPQTSLHSHLSTPNNGFTSSAHSLCWYHQFWHSNPPLKWWHLDLSDHQEDPIVPCPLLWPRLSAHSIVLHSVFILSYWVLKRAVISLGSIGPICRFPTNQCIAWLFRKHQCYPTCASRIDVLIPWIQVSSLDDSLAPDT